MKSLIINSAIILTLIGFLSSCKNDLEVNAPYKEVPSVYAILTPQESMQMIRINKIFLGDGDANKMAKIADSVNYQAGELTVMLERFLYGTKVAAESVNNKTEIIFRDSVIQTEDGAFNTTQRVYVTNDKLFNSGVYKLTITNNHTGNKFTASATAFDSIPLSGYPPMAPPYYPVPYSPSNPTYYYVDYSNSGVNYNIKCAALKGANIQDLTIRLHYYDSLSDQSVIHNTLDFVFYPQQTPTDGSTLSFSFHGSDLFLEYGNMLQKRPFPSGLVGRRLQKIDYLAYATTQEYNDYLQFAAPSLGFNQQKVIYSNFDDRAALGLFTFRTRCLFSKEISNTYVDEFAVNKYTCSHRFYNSALQLPGCP